MSKISNQRLKEIIDSKLKSLELEPGATSWDKILNALPQQNIAVRPRIDFTKIVLTFTSLFLITGGSLLIPEQSLEIKIIKKDNTSGQAISADKNNAIENRISCNDSSNDSGVSRSGITDKRIKRSVSIFDTLLLNTNPSESISTNSDTSSFISKKSLGINDHERKSSSEFSSLPFESADTVLHQEPHLSAVDSVLGDTLIIPSSSYARKDTLNSQKAPEKEGATTGQWIVKFFSFYNTNYFIPNTTDNFHVNEFQQSSSITKNRLGISLGIGRVKQISPKLEIEYSLTYRFFSKNFNYKLTEVGVENSVTVSTVTVDDGIHALGGSIAFKSPLLGVSYPIVFSLSYEKLFASDQASKIYGKQMLYGSFGVELPLNQKIKLRPSIQVGVAPANKNAQLSAMPINYGVEFVKKISSRKEKR